MASRFRNPFHHTVEDRLSRVDAALLERLAAGVSAAVGSLAGPDAQPRAP